VHSKDAFEGWGSVFMVADSLPILLALTYAVAAQRTPRLRTWWALCMMFLGFITIAIMCGGLRGSRATIVWSVMWAGGIVHVAVRRMTRKHVAMGIVAIVTFMYFYGFYKAVKLDALEALFDRGARAELEQTTQRTLPMVILGDMGRSDVQAYLLYRAQEVGDYEYQWGKTYLASLSLLIPRSIWRDRPVGKLYAGTEMIRGRGSYAADSYVQNIYGLSGEAFLNFGLAGAVLCYCFLGVVVGGLWTFASGLQAGDARQLLVPLAAILGFWLLVSDLDNVLWVLVKYGLVPVVVIYLASVREAVPRRLRWT
jgi:hypothetical protein